MLAVSMRITTYSAYKELSNITYTCVHNVCVYIYIYIYTHTHCDVYIYIYTHTTIIIIIYHNVFDMCSHYNYYLCMHYQTTLDVILLSE